MDRHAPFRRFDSRVPTRRSSSRSPLVRLVLVGGVVLAGGCDKAFAPQEGSVEVRVQTRYTQVQTPVGEVFYTAFVLDDEASNHRVEKPVTPAGTALFTNLGVGFRLKVGLEDFPEGCEVEPDFFGEELNPDTIRLTRDTLHQTVSFVVDCRLVPYDRADLEVVVLGLPDGVDAGIQLLDDSFSAVVSHTQVLMGLDPGVYEIQASDVSFEGVVYRAVHAFGLVSVKLGELSTDTVQYVAVPGNLVVNVTPADLPASVTVSGPNGFSRALQGSDTLWILPPGTYAVNANTVTVDGTNWQPSPLSQTIDVNSATTRTASVDYAAILGVGSLDVAVTGMPPGWDADVTVVDPSGGTVHLTGSGTLTDLAPGVYTVTAAALMADYRMEPEATSQDVVVTAGEAASVEVPYLTVSDNLLVDPSWEIGAITVATPVIPTATGEWHGDQVSPRGVENGIQPADGLWMLQFLASGPFGPGAGYTGSEIFQLLDISAFADVVDGGTAAVSGRALADRIAGDAETDTRFGVDIYAFDGAPADAAGKMSTQGWLARQIVQLDTDADPGTWEPIGADVALPAGSTVLLLRLFAAENVKDDATHPEFDGHYMDDASLVIRWKRTF